MTFLISNRGSRIESHDSFLYNKDKVANSIEFFSITIFTQQSTTQSNGAKVSQGLHKYKIKDSK